MWGEKSVPKVRLKGQVLRGKLLILSWKVEVCAGRAGKIKYIIIDVNIL